MAGGTWTSQNKIPPGVYINTKSKGNLQDNLGGNFTDAFSKASGQQNVAFQSANAVQGSTKVQVQNTDKKGLDNDNGAKVNTKEVKSQDISADKKLQETGEELVEKVKSDKELQEGFLKEPIPTLEKLLGVDLPEEQLKQIAEGVKAKINLDKAGDFIGGLLGKK